MVHHTRWAGGIEGSGGMKDAIGMVIIIVTFMALCAPEELGKTASRVQQGFSEVQP